MKSAWERALEKLDDAGIDRPDHESISDELRAQLETVRSRADAQLAELEIMFKKTQVTTDPAYQQLEANYQRDRQRVESKRDRDLAKLRS